MTTYCDNRPTSCIAGNQVFLERTKHIKMECHFITDIVMRKLICTLFTPLLVQLADVLTNAVSHIIFSCLCNKISMTDIYAPT